MNPNTSTLALLELEGKPRTVGPTDVSNYTLVLMAFILIVLIAVTAWIIVYRRSGRGAVVGDAC